MNKSGQFDVARKTIYWMMAGLVITIVVMAFAIMVGTYNSKLAKVSPLMQAEIISLRFTNTAECFVYYDEEANRIYPGIIDKEKFTLEQINSCYKTEQEKGFREMNFRLILAGQEVITNNYFHHDELILKRLVYLKDGDQFTEEELTIYVQVEI